MQYRASTFLMVTMLGLASGAEAAIISTSFDELQVGEGVLEFYNGGFGSLGTGPGPNLFISFGPGWIAGLPDNYGAPGGKSAAISAVAVVNLHQGFAGITSFYYTGAPLVVDFYDQESGLGTLVREFSLPLAFGGVNFGGVAGGNVPFFKSVVFRSTGNRIDQLTFGSQVVPEPGTLEFSLPGVAVLSLAGLSRSWRRVRREMIRLGPSLSCLFLVLSVCASIANAGSIPITGSAQLRQDFFGDIERFSFSGPGLDILSNPLTVVSPAILACTQGEICDLTLRLRARFESAPGSGNGGTVDGKTANALAGTMTFSGAAFIPIPVPDPFTAPVTLMGHVTGFQYAGPPTFTSTEVFEVFVTGTGTVNLSVLAAGRCPPNCAVSFRTASWSFTGTAVVIPEPATILLLATGLVCIGALVRAPRRSGMRRVDRCRPFVPAGPRSFSGGNRNRVDLFY
jgi:hypothetical protein